MEINGLDLVELQLRVAVEPARGRGHRGSAGQPLLTVEAMKIEHTHLAPINGTLAALLVTPDQQVTLRQVLAEVVALTT